MGLDDVVEDQDDGAAVVVDELLHLGIHAPPASLSSVSPRAATSSSLKRGFFQ